MKNNLIEALKTVGKPMGTNEIQRFFAKKGRALPIYELTKSLRILLQEGCVEFRKGNWQLLGRSREIPVASTPRFNPLLLSREGLSLLNNNLISFEAEFENPKSHSASEPSSLSHKFLGPWGQFRTLLNYYSDCIRNDGGAEALANLNDPKPKFFFFSLAGSLFPKENQSWQHSLPLGVHMGEFVRQLTSGNQEKFLVLGYPLQVVHFKRENEPDSYLLKPVFQYPLEYSLGKASLLVQCDQPSIQINLDWLQHTFQKPEQRNAFLSACGFVGNDDAEKGDFFSAGIVSCVATLSAFLGNVILEPLNLNAIPSGPLPVPLHTGIYNRAVLMLAKRPQYTKNLLHELAVIADTTDAELDKTALSFLFRTGNPIPKTRKNESFSPGLIDLTPLNSEQRNAVEDLLKEPITVITGPPGTGKSQVVCAAITNSSLWDTPVLFSSRNHRAIETVFDRCRIGDEPLLVRCNSREDPNLRVDFSTKIGAILAGNPAHTGEEKISEFIQRLRHLLLTRSEKLTQASVLQKFQDDLGQIEEERTAIELKWNLSESLSSTIREKATLFPINAWQKLRALTIQNTSLFRSCLAFPLWWNLKSFLAHVHIFSYPLSFFCNSQVISDLRDRLPFLDAVEKLCACQIDIAKLECEIKRFPTPQNKLVTEIAELTDDIAQLANKVFNELNLFRSGLFIDEDRELFANLRSSLRYLSQGTSPTELQVETRKLLNQEIPNFLRHCPAWTVTSLSVGSRIPLLPAIFDLVIIDEASQSDIPSAIPLLYRAQRAGVVGDPQQLTHVTNLSLAKDSMLRRRAGLDKLAQQRFSFVDTSLYSLFASTNGVSPVFLCETFRSSEEIADYANALFYNGRLRVATDISRLVSIPGMKPGVHWTETCGEIKNGGISGAYCSEEIFSVMQILLELISNPGFQGTIGIVTPFREQANRLRDTVHNGDMQLGRLQACNVKIDTAHGFQGDERDIIIFSLCAGPGMPPGSLHFLRETGNLFNVAVSRARSVLRVVGNRLWAQSCGIRHIERLAKPFCMVSMPLSQGPWAPYESPWEQRLANALAAEGMTPIPQHPVANRRLDLALIKMENPRIQIDIEVDGACCHRNPDGTRKIEDVWRDVQLMGLGWRVLRFWVYQLRDDMNGCVQKVLQEWRRNNE